MGETALTNEERIQALEHLGYSEREARFLCLAALHGGFFLRRQYVQFTEKAVGGSAAILIEKALAKGHVRSTTFAAGIHIYHLCSRPFYRAIGEENNRNRRLHAPTSMKAKLMALDFVLSHAAAQFLSTEKEKLDYFRGSLAIDSAFLPSTQYMGRDRRTERFFVEKFPIFVTAGPAPAGPTVSLSFVDEGAAAVSGFETFLRKYQPLLSALATFELIYVAASDVHFAAAARAFARLLDAQDSASSALSTALRIDQLLPYFRTRQLIEAKKFDALNRADLIDYRNAVASVSESKFHALYQRWVTEGEVGARTALIPKFSFPMKLRGTFSACLLEKNYELFSIATV